MKKNDSPEKILELLKNARNIALFTHSRPDGDVTVSYTHLTLPTIA